LKRIAHRIAWLSFLFTLAFASSARAAGVALRWGGCDGTANRNFACDRSTGSEMLVGMFEAPGGVSMFTGIEVILRISAASGGAPSWWQMGPGGCRHGCIQVSTDFSDQMACGDPWEGQAGGGIALYQSGSNGIDVQMVESLPIDDRKPLSPGQTYGAFKLLINHRGSSGPSACGGCDTPVCVRLEAIKVVQPDPRFLGPGTPAENSDPIYNVLNTSIAGMGGLAQVATWQGGTPDCGAGLTKPSTWSELKSRFKSH